MFYGADGSGPEANDVYAKNNNTLDQWHWHGSSAFISNHLGRALIFQRSKIEFCTGYTHSGTCVHIQAHDPRDPYARLTNSPTAKLLSFAWNK